MSNNNGGNAGSAILIIIVIVAMLGIIGSCFSSNDDYKKTLNDGLNKYYSGDEMTKQEHDAVKSYHKWMNDQKKNKKYSDWD